MRSARNVCVYDIHLTANDIARVTVMPKYSPLTEVIYSLSAICKPRTDFSYGAWSRDLGPPSTRVARILNLSCPPLTCRTARLAAR